MSPYKEKPITVKITVDGKPYYVRAKDERTARRRAEERRAKIEAGRVVSKDMRVEAWFEEWMETYKRDAVNDRNFRDKQGTIKNFIVPSGSSRFSLRGKKVSAVKHSDCQKILSGMVAEGYSDTYIKKVRDLLHGAFEMAVVNGICLSNPAQGLSCPKGKPNRKRRPITDKERELTLKVCESNRGGIFVLLMLFCGLRPQEAGALLWEDVDFDGKALHVSRALKSEGGVGGPKSAAGYRMIPIPGYLLNRLQAVKKPSGLVCTNSQGGRYNSTSIRRMWEHFKHDLNTAAGCKTFRNSIVPPAWVAEDLTLYCYRHTYCCDLRDAGVPVETARILMGHDSISITAEIYQHQTAESVSAAKAKLDAFQGSKVAPEVAPSEADTDIV